MADRLLLLSCEHYRAELEAVLSGEDAGEVVAGFYSPDCGQPPLGWDQVRTALDDLGRKRDEEVHLLGGGCLLKLGELPHSLRPLVVHRASHCCDFLGGPSLVADRIHAGAYVVSPGWLRSWPDTLEKWQMDAPLAREFFAESSQRLVLFDSGVVPGIQEDLVAFAAFVGLPHETITCGLDRVRLVVESLVSTWRLRQARRELELETSQANRQSAELLMTMDLIRGIAVLGTKDEAVKKTRNLFEMLFAPTAVVFAPPGGVPVKPEGPGFTVPVTFGEESFGRFWVEGVAFPEHQARYEEVSRLVADVCGLAFANADAHERVKTLRGLIPICMHCKKIRDDGGYWQKVEKYLSENSEVQMSHGCCPECLATHYGITDLDEED